MKRIIIVIAVLLMVTNVFGTELTDGSGTTTVLYREESHYSVRIPETITVDGTLYGFTASEMDLNENERVLVTVSGLEGDGILQMMSRTNKWMMAQFYDQNGKTVTDGRVVSEFMNGVLEGYGKLYALPLQTEGAGEYSGSITFNISLVNEG